MQEKNWSTLKNGEVSLSHHYSFFRHKINKDFIVWVWVITWKELQGTANSLMFARDENTIIFPVWGAKNKQKKEIGKYKFPFITNLGCTFLSSCFLRSFRLWRLFSIMRHTTGKWTPRFVVVHEYRTGDHAGWTKGEICSLKYLPLDKCGQISTTVPFLSLGMCCFVRKRGKIFLLYDPAAFLAPCTPVLGNAAKRDGVRKPDPSYLTGD